MAEVARRETASAARVTLFIRLLQQATRLAFATLSSTAHECVLNGTVSFRISMAARPQDVITFWRNAGPSQWFAAKPAFDEAIRLKFEPTHHAAARGDYDAWQADAEGA